MTQTVAVPFWLLLLILGFALTAFLSHFLFPSVRWFFRRRMERAIAQLNSRLERPLEPFKLMARQDMIVRLSYDPKVMEAVVEHAKATGIPESVAFQEARSYAREIVPSFSATVYFGVAIRAAHWLSRIFYTVRLGRVDGEIAKIDRSATVVFVMNHRSNMDYVLVTWLVAERSAISYAVGEWARVWPLSGLIRATGAYFIRRNSKSNLYRRVLARYVQMASAEGTTTWALPGAARRTSLSPSWTTSATCPCRLARSTSGRSPGSTACASVRILPGFLHAQSWMSHTAPILPNGDGGSLNR
jgi:glycerol-3-phosphate O-acyltransferase